jgi:NitT/TauT family transport system substrate-binding protein
LLLVCTLAAIPLGPALSQAKLEKTDVTVGVGGKLLLYYLPLTIAERLGYFKAEGLNVDVVELGGGARSLEALVGGSADAVAAAYENTIRMQARGKDVRAVVELGRYPGIVLALRKEKAALYRSPADLKGMKIGVTAIGSSSQILVSFLMAKAGLKPDDASFIGVGGGATAVAAMEKGELDAISHLDPVISKLLTDNAISVVVDTRTSAGAEAVFGGTDPAGTLLLRKDFIDANPHTVQALVNAFQKALQWLRTASSEQIVDTVPPEYWLGDKALYLRTVEAARDVYSPTGDIPAEGMRVALQLVTTAEPSFNASAIKLDDTVDLHFLAAANQK